MDNHICIDCNVDTSGHGICEYYMVQFDIWDNLLFDPKEDARYLDKKWYFFKDEVRYEGMLCIGCLERRLGRELNADDFLDCPLNTEYDSYPRSDRLLERMTRSGHG